MTMQSLRDFRKANGLSQKELADKIEVDRVTIARWETGSHKIDVDKLWKVAEVTGIPKRKLRPDLADLLEERQ